MTGPDVEWQSAVAQLAIYVGELPGELAAANPDDDLRATMAFAACSFQLKAAVTAYGRRRGVQITYTRDATPG